MHSVRVGCLKQPLLQELGGTVSNLTITFHLTESQTTITDGNTHGEHECEKEETNN